MLLKKPIQEEDVVVIRLATGEEVAGKYVSSDPNVVTLKKPRTFHFQQMPNGQISAAMGPVAMTVDPDQTMTFLVSALVFMPVPAKKEIVASYTQATSGIEIVTGTSSLIK